MKKMTNNYVYNLIERYPNLKDCQETISQSIQLIIDCYNNSGKLLCCGNGGSATDCEHIAGELVKGFLKKRELSKEQQEKINDDDLSSLLQQSLPCIPLVSNPGLLTAICNDQSDKVIFAQQVLGYGKENDVLLCISTSGSSKNCVYAAKVARALNMKIISLTGEKDSPLSILSDVCIKAPATETYKIQELHLPIYHAICSAIEYEFFGE